MILIQCTKKLLDELHIDDSKVAISHPTYSMLENWHANLIRVERKKCLLFTNDSTLFSFLIPRVTKQHFQHLSSVFINNLSLNLAYESLDEHLSILIPPSPTDISFIKSNSRKILGSMNGIVLTIHSYIAHSGGLNELNVLALNHVLNNIPLKVNQYRNALECLHTKIQQSFHTKCET